MAVLWGGGCSGRFPEMGPLNHQWPMVLGMWSRPNWKDASGSPQTALGPGKNFSKTIAMAQSVSRDALILEQEILHFLINNIVHCVFHNEWSRKYGEMRGKNLEEEEEEIQIREKKTWSLKNNERGWR